MIPVKLSVQGLYSYQALQEIEFQPLIGASVFGIFGKVGSGKSSLLEAISFALYGKTERLNASGDSRAYNMMNLKSDHLIIDFEFRAGADLQRYKFVYEAKRHQKKHEKIETSKHRSFVWDENQWTPLGLEKDDIETLTESIIGLDYDNFKRTIIIPQNQFREFIELKATDRTEMMSRMFRLEKYDLARQTLKLKEANEAALNSTRGLLEGVGDSSPEAIEAARQSGESIEKAIQEKDKEVKQAAARENQLIQLQKRHQERDKATKTLEKLKIRQPDYQKIRRQIEQYEQCIQWFSLLFSQADGIDRQQQDITKNLQQAEKQLTFVHQRLPGILQVYQTARLAYENRDSLKQQLDELEDVRLIGGNQSAIAQLTRNRDELQKNIKDQVIKIDTLKDDRARHLIIVSKDDDQATDLATLRDIQNWFFGYKPLKKAVDDLDKKIQANDKAIEAIKTRKTTALMGFPEEWNGLNLKQLPDTIQTAIEVLQSVARERQAIYDDHLLRKKVHQYAISLADGKPCPLCGSEHHPAISHDTTIDADIARSQDALTKANTRISDMNTLMNAVKVLFGEMKMVHGQGKDLINERTVAVLARTLHEDQFVWAGFTMEQHQAVADAILDENTRQDNLRNARKAIDSINENLERLEPKKASAELAVAKLNGELESLTNAVQQQMKKLTCFKPADIDKFNSQTISDLTDKLTEQYEQTKANFTDAERAKSAVEGEHTQYQTEVNNYKKQQKERRQDRDKLDISINDALALRGYTRQQIDIILASKLDTGNERQRIQEFEQELGASQTVSDNLTAELADQPFDPVEFEQVQANHLQVQNDSRTLYQQLGENRKIQGELTEKWEKKQGIQQELNAQLLRQKDLAEMTALFRAQGFVNYVSSVYLQNLCEAANERFTKLTNNHLKLEIDDKNNFLVRDHLNGGQTRLAKTLSGGQLFQASLSLALALSDNIQHLTKSRQNLFFLDEGFGSLDKDSLQTVFKTLQALRNENRIVGIISHVEELQHEVETFIRAEHTDTGSRITRSWE